MPDPRGSAASQLFCDFHGEADRGRAGLGHAHPSLDHRHGIRSEHLLGSQSGETDAFYHFIAGLQNHLPAGLAVMAPYVNSYRRYVKDHAAPINLEWARDNRTTSIRVPLSGPEARRVETRIAGMDCNPYLGIALSLAIQGQAEGFYTMARVPALPFPGGPALRNPLLVLAMTWFALRDRLGV